MRRRVYSVHCCVTLASILSLMRYEGEEEFFETVMAGIVIGMDFQLQIFSGKQVDRWLDASRREEALVFSCRLVAQDDKSPGE